MYEIKVNDNFKFELETHHSELKVNGELLAIDQIDVNSNTSHLIYKNKSYTIERVELDEQEKNAIVKVNGNLYTVSIKDQFDKLLQQLGMDSFVSNKILQVKAPMPGLVLSVLVAEGDEVRKGDSLLVLEAMKMENMIKSPSDGTIKKVEVVKGDKVDKNELLISFK